MLTDVIIGKDYSFLDAGESSFTFIIIVLGFSGWHIVDIHYINFSCALSTPVWN